MPKGRTVNYAIWLACERFGIRPPGVKPDWNDCPVDVQAELIAYNQGRELEEAEQVSL